MVNWDFPFNSMEASEKVVESYFRYVKKYFTIPNLRCGGQKEIDLIDWDPSVELIAAQNGIKLLRFSEILKEMMEEFGKNESYFSDDTVRLLQLLKKSNTEFKDIHKNKI